MPERVCGRRHEWSTWVRPENYTSSVVGDRWSETRTPPVGLPCLQRVCSELVDGLGPEACPS